MSWNGTILEKKNYLAGQKFATVAEIGAEKVQYVRWRPTLKNPKSQLKQPAGQLKNWISVLTNPKSFQIWSRLKSEYL